MSMRKVMYAKLHAEFFVPGLGPLGVTLPNERKAVSGFEMLFGDLGLTLKWKQGSAQHEALVPPGNIVLVHFAPLEAETKAAKKPAA